MTGDAGFGPCGVGAVAAPCPPATLDVVIRTWGPDCVAAILCRQDRHLVPRLAQTKVLSVEDMYFEDPYFDGTRWTIRQVRATGTAEHGAGVITLKRTLSCDDAAVTVYHELLHLDQDPGMDWPHPREDDAYYRTEEWTILRGLPGQGLMRTWDAACNRVPDPAAIREHVDAIYPVRAAGDAGPQPVGYEVDQERRNWTIVVDPVTRKRSKRPSVKGDTFQGKFVRVRVEVVDPKEWKCPQPPGAGGPSELERRRAGGVER